MNGTREYRRSLARLSMIALASTLFAISTTVAGQTCEPEWNTKIGQPGVGWPGVLNSEWVEDMTVYNGELIAGGNFVQSGGKPVFRIARWDSAAAVWQPFVVDGVIGMNAHVWNLLEYNGDLISSGNFTSAGGEPVNHIARWDGSSWHSLNGGMAGGLPGQPFSVGTPSVIALAEYNGDLVAGGNFISAGGVSADFIARWQQSSDSGEGSWHPLGSGMNGPVSALLVHDGDLIAGGNFTTAGGAAANRIARWDGTSWHPVGGGMNTWVLGLAVLNGDLVAAGLFTTADGSPASYIARWEGDSVGWRPLGNGMNAGVWDLFTHNGTLYAGGTFVAAGGRTANRIARWDPSSGSEGSWLPLGDGTNWNVYALTAFEGNLIVGGRYTTAGGEPANRVAAWFACPPCAADLTGSGTVGLPDLLELLAQWGPCSDPRNCPADLTGSGSVGVPDLLELLAQWGECP